MAASPALLGRRALCMRASFSGHIQSSSGFRTHTVSQGRKRPLPGTVPRGPAHVSWGLPQPLAAPGAGAGWVCLSLEWAVGSGSWREGGCYTDLAASLSPPHLPHPPSRWENRGSGGVAQAVVAGGPERHTDTASAHVLGKLTGQLTPFLWLPPTRPGAPSCPRFLSDK